MTAAAAAEPGPACTQIRGMEPATSRDIQPSQPYSTDEPYSMVGPQFGRTLHHGRAYSMGEAGWVPRPPRLQVIEF